MAKLDASGNHVWSKRFGGADDDGADGVSVDAAGNVVLAGLSTGTINLGGGALPSGASFVGKLDASGNHVWSKGFGGMVQIQGRHGGRVERHPRGGRRPRRHLLGTTSLPASSGGMDVLVLRLDSAGNYVWGRRAPAPAPRRPRPRSRVNAGHASAIAGSTRSGSLNLGTGGPPRLRGVVRGGWPRSVREPVAGAAACDRWSRAAGAVRRDHLPTARSSVPESQYTDLPSVKIGTPGANDWPDASTVTAPPPLGTLRTVPSP